MMDALNEFLRSYPPEVRHVVKSSMPEACEALYLSQNHIRFSLTGAVSDQLIYLVPKQARDWVV